MNEEVEDDPVGDRLGHLANGHKKVLVAKHQQDDTFHYLLEDRSYNEHLENGD